MINFSLHLSFCTWRAWTLASLLSTPPRFPWRHRTATRHIGAPSRCAATGVETSVLIQRACLPTFIRSDRLIRLQFLMLICSQMKQSIWLFWSYPGVEDTGFSVLRNSAGTEVLTGHPLGKVRKQEVWGALGENLSPRQTFRSRLGHTSASASVSLTRVLQVFPVSSRGKGPELLMGKAELWFLCPRSFLMVPRDQTFADSVCVFP